MIRIGMISALLALAAPAWAVSPPFTFQGALEDGGAPANGSYDLKFTVKSDNGFVLAPPITLEDVAVVGGVFTVTLDFGDGVFVCCDVLLGVLVRPGTSSGAFVALSPDLPLNATPYALTANNALTAWVADDVVDAAIDSADIASSAVTTTKLQDNAVTAAKLADDAVTAAKLASNSVSIASFIGGSGSGSITATISASDCSEYNLSFPGTLSGDFVMVNTDPLPDDIIITAMNAPAADTVRIKVCNVGSATQSFSDLGIRYVSLR